MNIYIITNWLIALLISTVSIIFGNAKAQVAGTPYLAGWQKPSCMDKNTYGTDFWLTYGEVWTGPYPKVTDAILLLQIATQKETSITLTLTDTGQSYSFTLPANTVKLIDFAKFEYDNNQDRRSSIYLLRSTGLITNRSLHITSSEPISVYNYTEYAGGEADASLVVPTSLWDTDYYNMSYKAYNVLNTSSVSNANEIIIAKEDNTTVTLYNGTTQNLNAGNVFVIAANKQDFTGRHITSNKPVGYIANVAAANIPSDRSFVDNIFEQMMPVSNWGKTFLVPNIRPGSNSMNSIIRIIASEDNTVVNYSTGTAVKTAVEGSTSINSGGILNKGQWVELQFTGSSENVGCYITANKPVGVCSYMVGGFFTNNGGDPSIAWVPPLEQMISKTLIAPFILSAGSTVFHKMLVVTKTSNKNLTTVNGAAPATPWTDDAASGYSFNRMSFTNSTDFGKSFNIENPASGVLVWVYGYSSGTVFMSYFYNGGSGGCDIN